MAKPPVQRNVTGFLEQVRCTQLPSQTVSSRIVFALDATASREATWDLATTLHAELFLAAADIARVAVQLVYFRGYNEFHASSWSTEPKMLLEAMTNVRCRGGMTQIDRTLRHVVNQAREAKIQACILVGDAFEESLPSVAKTAGQLGLYNVPVFAFQEGHDPGVSHAFKTIATLTRGAHVPFSTASAADLRALLGAVARYAATGRRDLDERRLPRVARDLLAQLPP